MEKDWVEHHYQAMIKSATSNDPGALVNAANNYVSNFAAHFMLVRRNLTLEDLEPVIMAYDRLFDGYWSKQAAPLQEEFRVEVGLNSSHYRKIGDNKYQIIFETIINGKRVRRVKKIKLDNPSKKDLDRIAREFADSFIEDKEGPPQE